MRLTILGCHGPYPTKHTHALSGYLLTDQSTNLVMDFGSGVLARLSEQISLADISGIFISHLHYDHTSDLMPLKYALENTLIKINIYTAQSNTNWYREIQNCPNFNLVNISENTPVECGTLTLKFYPARHSVPTFALRAEGNRTLFYTADTTYFDELPRYANGADAILADCVKPVNFKGPHMKYTDALMLRDLTGSRLIATHVSGDYNDHPFFADHPDVIVAEEGKIIEI